MEYRVVGENIRKYRKRLKLTQDELADRVGVTWEMISRYERGENSPMNKLSTIATALNISVGDLVDTENEISYQVPLFTKIPKDFLFKKDNTFTYYNAPTWIIKLDPDSFALDIDIVERGNLISGGKGFLFVSPNTDLSSNDIVLVSRKTGIHVEKYDSSLNGVIGKILMQEIVY